MSNNDELGLAPLDDDELSLPMIEAKVEKIVASEVKPKPGQRLVPVVCAICHTRMYAVEDQIGQWKRCPDCDSLTEIKTVPEKAIFTTKETELEGSFNLSEAEVDSRDLHQLREEAKRQTRAAAVGIYDTILDIPLGPSPEDMNENTPMLERLFNTILTSSEEKEERRKIAEREKRIQEQADAIKHAAQLGALESFFKKPEPSASKSPSAQLKSVAPPPLPKSFSAPTPAPPQSTRIPFSFAPKKSALKPTLALASSKSAKNAAASHCRSFGQYF